MEREGRVLSLDHIRGLAALGILAVNAIAFAQPMAVYSNPMLSMVPPSDADLRLWWIVDVFFRDKFVTTFTLLFGVSVFLVGRGDDGTVPAYRTPLFRRLAWLLVFGLIHGALIWHGDILLAYAVTAFIFWPWRKAGPRLLIGWGLFLFFAGAAVLLLPTLSIASGTAAAPEDIVGVVSAMRGDFTHSLAGNFHEWSSTIISELISFLPTTLGLMMLGAGLFKLGFYAGGLKPRVYLILIGAAAVSLVLIAVQSSQSVASRFVFPEAFGLYRIADTVLCLPVALGYASLLILAARLGVVRILLYPLACVGRMAFTNYLTQSLVMTALFYGGRGQAVPWFGEMNDAGLLPIVVTIWAVQVVVSTIWMSLFRYGPFEWGWRCLTYKRWVKLRG